MNESRMKNVKKNVIFGNIESISSLILSVVSRTIFISYLGMEYLGISGLFSNVLGLLAFTELGIGTAMNYSLYRPIAENDVEKIKSLMCLYKKAYHWIAIVILGIGVIILPLLPLLVKSDYGYDHIYIYYLLYLFDTVSSYFVTYKYAYVTALQKGYIITNLNVLLNFCVQITQIIAMVVFKSFLLYLIVQIIFRTVQKIITVLYLDKQFPILTEKKSRKLDLKTQDTIKKDIKALIIHKIGDASVHQTDNIIISIFINTITVGLMSNYIMIQNTVARFTNTFFNSFTASLGNLITSESKHRQEEVLDQYTFLGFWIFGFTTTAFISLSQPLFTLWGRMTNTDMLVDNLTMVLYFITVYLGGQSLTFYNFKVAAGIFDDDKYVALIQAIVNLIVSIMAVFIIGLPGVYIGTIVQRLVALIWKPIIVYKKQFDKSPKHYFTKTIKYGITTTIACVLNIALLKLFFKEITMMSFLGMTITTAFVPNLFFVLVRGKDVEFKALFRRVIYS